jgi:hypothetical protein
MHNKTRPPRTELPWIDQWLGPIKGSPLAKLSTAVRRLIVENEVRRRARKADDEVRFKVMVDVITANLAKVHFDGKPGLRNGSPGLRILTGHGTTWSHSRYDNPAIGIPFRFAVEVLSMEVGLIGWFSTHHGVRIASSIHPSEKFIAMMEEYGVTAAHLAKLSNSHHGHAAEEVVLLRQKDKGVGWMAGAGARAVMWERQWQIDYRDTKETMTLRSTVRGINSHIVKADITYLGPEPVPVNVRTLHRAFTTTDGTIRWDLGGRLFGGFWLTLPKVQRHWLRIEGEDIMSVDFKSTLLQLALVSQGYEPAKGDPYAIQGFSHVDRKVVKQAVSALLCAQSVNVWIEGMVDVAGEPAMHKFREALIHHHPGLKGTLGKGLGHRLMNTESRILIEALRLLAKQGIVALPLHDCVLIKRSKVAVGGTAMLSAAEAITGHRLPVTIEPPQPPPSPLPTSLPTEGGRMEEVAT